MIENWPPMIKHKIFISYHHQNDQQYYDALSKTFSASYDAVTDNSLDREIDSNNVDYVLQRIRDNYITGTSCTLVLCGQQTPWRKYVDWEIKATLDKQHGLIGVNLPTNLQTPAGKCTVPDRLYDNVGSGYAIWTNWSYIMQNLTNLPMLITQAKQKSSVLIVNQREMRSRNG